MFRGDAVEMVVIHYLLSVNDDDTTVMITRQSIYAVWRYQRGNQRP